jgi:hypothetical protein
MFNGDDTLFTNSELMKTMGVLVFSLFKMGLNPRPSLMNKTS